MTENQKGIPLKCIICEKEVIDFLHEKVCPECVETITDKDKTLGDVIFALYEWVYREIRQFIRDILYFAKNFNEIMIRRLTK